MARQKFKLPDLSNATPSFLVDELESCRALQSHYKTLEGVLKQALKARMETGATEVKGEKYTAVFTQRSKRSLSSELVIAKFGEEALADCYVDSEYEEIRTKENE